MSIAAAVLEALRSESDLHPGQRIVRAGLRIGEISGVETDSLRFCLEALAPESDWPDITFEFEKCPWTRRCTKCGVTFEVRDYRPECSACGSVETEAAGGDQIEFAYLEMEEP